jgi:hypothetical protein
VATFTVEQGKKGERVKRVTINPKTNRPNKPKTTTYALKARIVTGDDGKTYIAELTQYGHISIIQSNLQYQEESIGTDDPRYTDMLSMFGEVTYRIQQFIEVTPVDPNNSLNSGAYEWQNIDATEYNKYRSARTVIVHKLPEINNEKPYRIITLIDGFPVQAVKGDW